MILWLTDPSPLPACLIVSLLRDVMGRLRGALGFGDATHKRAAMLAPFSAYMGRVLSRFAALVRRHEAGLMRPHAVRPSRAGCKAPVRPRVRLPMARAWVRAVVGWRSGGVSGQVETLLSRPDAAGILALYPQAQAMFRPLCHMLGISPASVPALAKRVRRGAGSGAGAAASAGKRPRRRLTRREREAILRYPNSEGQPMKLLPRRLPRD